MGVCGEWRERKWQTMVRLAAGVPLNKLLWAFEKGCLEHCEVRETVVVLTPDLYVTLSLRYCFHDPEIRLQQACGI